MVVPEAHLTCKWVKVGVILNQFLTNLTKLSNVSSPGAASSATVTSQKLAEPTMKTLEGEPLFLKKVEEFTVDIFDYYAPYLREQKPNPDCNDEQNLTIANGTFVSQVGGELLRVGGLVEAEARKYTARRDRFGSSVFVWGPRPSFDL